MAKTQHLLLGVLVVVLSFIVVTSPANTLDQSTKQNGISFATWWSGQYSRPDADLALSNLAATGANWISLIVTGYQDTITSTAIFTNTATPTDADLIHVITQAHSLGLQVMLKPHLDLANDPAHWRGQIGQTFTETQWAAWFAAYQMFINRYAQLAQTYSAEQFCVGTELSATESRANDWRTAIAGIRSRYSGPLTYAANHGSEASLTWWDAVDYIGVDAYYPLTNKNNPTVADLKGPGSPIQRRWPRLRLRGTRRFSLPRSVIAARMAQTNIPGTGKWEEQLTFRSRPIPTRRFSRPSITSRGLQGCTGGLGAPILSKVGYVMMVTRPTINPQKTSCAPGMARHPGRINVGFPSRTIAEYSKYSQTH